MIIIIGTLLRHYKVINNNFIAVSSSIIFNITLPTLVFLKVSSLDIHEIHTALPSISIIYAVTIGVFIISWAIASRFIKNGKDLGAFMQGTYRGNFATLGLAASSSLYGADGLAEAALLLAFIVPLYNILGVIALAVPLGREQKITPARITKEIFLNPILVAVISAIPFAILSLEIPVVVNNTANYLAELTIPLALLGIGGVLQFQNRNYSISAAISASLIKVIIMPIIGIITIVALLASSSLSNQTIGILFIVFACPTTSASFIMAQAMGANSQLASAIVVISTGLSGLTMGLGLYLLHTYII